MISSIESSGWPFKIATSPPFPQPGFSPFWLKNKTGLEIENYKDPDNFLNTFKEHVISDAKIEPNEKIKTYEADISSLRDTLTNKEAEFNKILGSKPPWITTFFKFIFAHSGSTS